MNDKFFDLPKEKQDKIINGAVKIFAINGYKKASTDDMVRDTGVSKGLWFHYFENKLGLYTFVSDYIIRFYCMELSSMMPEGGDYFKKIYEIERIKVEVSKFYEYAPMLLTTLVNERDEEAMNAVKGYVRTYLEAIAAPFENLPDEFSPDINTDILDMTINYTTYGIMKEAYLTGKFARSEYLGSLQAYLDMMRKIAY